MKLGITSSIFIIVAIASAKCQMYPEIIANWTRTGPKIIQHGCPTTARTEELSRRYPDCLYYCKDKQGDWKYGFYNPGTNCSYGNESLPGSCFNGNCYLILETLTEVTPTETKTNSTPPMEKEATPTEQVEKETAPTEPIENETAPKQPLEEEAPPKPAL
uniref:Putative basic tail protein n=1 Tax=Ixodes ricinus TaxID=34613 RepID=A0A0K8RHG2_IXORI